MKRVLFLLSLVSVFNILSCSGKKDAVPVPVQPKVYSFASTPAWADEFNTDGAPDPAKWYFNTGGTGWGNNELEYYTNKTDNASIANGMLSITARKQDTSGMSYTSARMIAKSPADLLYGRIEVRAKLPAGRGTWPAIWMLPNDYAYGDGVNSGEIDIMEHVGYDPGNVYFSVHDQVKNGTNSNHNSLNIPTATTDFHIYRCDWTPESIKGYYDNVLVITYLNDGKGWTTWPFDKSFRILLNVAIGGSWGGLDGVDDTIFPTAMQVDYVRYYKLVTK